MHDFLFKIRNRNQEWSLIIFICSSFPSILIKAWLPDLIKQPPHLTPVCSHPRKAGTQAYFEWMGTIWKEQWGRTHCEGGLDGFGFALIICPVHCRAQQHNLITNAKNIILGETPLVWLLEYSIRNIPVSIALLFDFLELNVTKATCTLYFILSNHKHVCAITNQCP